MRDTIISYLSMIRTASADMIAEEAVLDRDEVQKTLHQMDDDGDVIMSLGWYRLSEVSKKRLGRLVK